METGKDRKVRVTAKIRGLTDLEVESGVGGSKEWITVQKPNGENSDAVTISLVDQSEKSRNECYKVDYCYERDEGNDVIFSRDVKPLISGVFDGHDATVVAYGARSSGKTYLIQGSEDEPGLAVLAMAEVLSLAEKNGKSVSVSFYEISKEHAYDLLDPKKPEVVVLNDAQGKIQLRGLSKVPVKSILEFQKFYLSGRDSHKAQTKIAEPPCRSHKGLIFRVFQSEKPGIRPIGKMNFVDLAGYEDVRRKSTDGLVLSENTKINKSLYALQNVVHALNANESHIPYRDSTLTRMLRTSLGGTNKILMVACLTPFFCQDSLHVINLASRSCLRINQSVLDTTKKNKSSTRPVVHSTQKSRTFGSVSSSVRKQTSSRVPFSERKENVTASERKEKVVTASAIKGRKLFTPTCRSTASKKEPKMKKVTSPKAVSASEHHVQEEATTQDNVSASDHPVLEEEMSSLAIETAIPSYDPEASSMREADVEETPVADQEILPTEEYPIEVTPSINRSANALHSVDAGETMDKENNSLLVNESSSPPISERLQEISNSLKLILTTPSCVEVPTENDTANSQLSIGTVEPKTPEPSSPARNKWELADISSSPWQSFSVHSTGVKNSLVQEYLKFLNTADKEELKKLKGIGEKRATYILELREESPEPFKDLDDLKDIGLSAKQIKGLMKKEVGGLFN